MASCGCWSRGRCWEPLGWGVTSGGASLSPSSAGPSFVGTEVGFSSWSPCVRLCLWGCSVATIPKGCHPPPHKASRLLQRWELFFLQQHVLVSTKRGAEKGGQGHLGVPRVMETAGCNGPPLSHPHQPHQTLSRMSAWCGAVPSSGVGHGRRWLEERLAMEPG